MQIFSSPQNTNRLYGEILHKKLEKKFSPVNFTISIRQKAQTHISCVNTNITLMYSSFSYNERKTVCPQIDQSMCGSCFQSSQLLGASDWHCEAHSYSVIVQ